MAEPAPLGHGRVLKIALPIMLSNITIPLLGLVDTGVVGQLGEAAPIAAVGVGAITLATIYWIFGFLRMGTTGMVAQALGAGDRAEIAALWSRATLIGLIGGLALMALYLPLTNLAFRVAPASAEVEALAHEYMAIRIWAAPAAIAIYAQIGWLIAQERTGAVLIHQLWMNGVNIALDLLFVLGFDWGVEGVAWATFIAEWSGLALGIWLCRDVFTIPEWCAKARIFDRARLAQIARVNSDIMLRSLLLSLSFWSFMVLGGLFGDETHAANQILLQFLEMISFALDGFALAAETLVGQAVGARSARQLGQAARMAGIWGAGTALALVVAFGALGPMVIDLMATSEEVREAARAYLPWIVITPLFGAASFILDGIFIGATRTRDLRNMMIVSVAGYAAVMALVIGPLGNHGLWLAMMVLLALRGVTLWLRYPALVREV